MKISLLDVTLRDGGYKNKFDFSPSLAAATVKNLILAGVKKIEIGYRNGSLKPISGIGPAGLSTNEYIKHIKIQNPQAELFVMAHPKNITENDLLEIKESGASGIRLCLDHSDLPRSFNFIQEAHNLGLFVTSNITRASLLPAARVQALAEMSTHHGAHIIYFADSNGGMLPHEVSSLTSKIRDCVKDDAEVGFHAHNNLSLALSNTLAAIESGAKFIDSSLRGMGRGAGNLSTELIVSYLERIHQNHDFNLPIVFQAAEKWERTMPEVMSLELKQILFGMANLSADFEVPVNTYTTQHNIPWYRFVSKLAEVKAQIPSTNLFESIVQDLKRPFEIGAVNLCKKIV